MIILIIIIINHTTNNTNNSILLLLLQLLLLLGNGQVMDLWTKRTFSQIISNRPRKTSHCQQHTCPKQRLIFNIEKKLVFDHIRNTDFQQHTRVGQHTQSLRCCHCYVHDVGVLIWQHT